MFDGFERKTITVEGVDIACVIGAGTKHGRVARSNLCNPLNFSLRNPARGPESLPLWRTHYW